jgi:hypothetical protein
MYKRFAAADVMKNLLFGEGLQAMTRRGCIVRRASCIAAQLALCAVMVTGVAKAWCLTDKRPTAADLPTCSYSDLAYNSDASLLREKAPTRFKLMPSRYVEIVQAARGDSCTGTATVAFNGHNYSQVGINDDPGIPELIPTISSLTGMSLADTFDLTVFAVVSLGIATGYAGFWHLCPDPRARLVGAAVFLCLGVAEATVDDVYIFQTSPLIAGIPWVLYFALGRKPRALNSGATLLAFCCSWCSLVRSGTTIICMAFLITLFACRYRIQKIFLPLLLIILACVPSMLYMRYLIARRNAILAALGDTITTKNSHLVWHSIYIGLAFIPNSLVPEYKDAVAINKVWSIDPTVRFGSAKYEAILRREVWNIAKQRPLLLLENFAAKAVILILSAWIILFPARRFLFAEREVFWLDAAFVLSMAMSATNVMMTVPRRSYLLTFLCLTLLYSCIKLCRGRFL